MLSPRSRARGRPRLAERARDLVARKLELFPWPVRYQDWTGWSCSLGGDAPHWCGEPLEITIKTEAAAKTLLAYDAMVLGNHEFNFGPTTFATMLEQVDFPILGGANLDDDGTYGFITDNVQDYITLDVDGVDVVIFGLTNPRVPRYELPTNIEGLTFYPATQTAASLVPTILATEDPDLLIGLTHVGYQPYGGEVDSDELAAQEVTGIDVIVGGHSHSRLRKAMMTVPTRAPQMLCIPPKAIIMMSLMEKNRSNDDGLMKFI